MFKSLSSHAQLAFKAFALGSASTALFSLPLTAEAQVATGSVTGKIVNSENGNNLQGALVRIPSLNLRTSADREGSFRFGRVPAGEHTLIVTYQGLEDLSQTITVTGEQALALDLEMVSRAAVMDTVMVTASPIADSEAAAFSRQKASDNLVNIVASDTIGRFPDQNVAAALSRLPGISVERDQGQERYVNLRGAPNKWTTISFNGLNVVSPEGRASRFDTIPNAIVSSIEATKAITADMPAESIAGNINIVTRNPFDKTGFNVSGEAAIGQLQLNAREQFNLSGTLSNTFANDTMGFLVSGTYYERNQTTDNIENRFERASEARGTAGEDLIFSRGTDIRVYHLVRSNKGVTGRFDWRPNANHELFISSIFTEFTDDEQRDQYVFDYDGSAIGGSAIQTEGCYAQVADPCNNDPISGTVFAADIDATFNTNNYRENIFTNTLGGDHLIGDWDINWRLNYTHTLDEFKAPARYTFTSPSGAENHPTVQYDYSDPDFPRTLLFETIDNGDGTFSAGDRITGIDDQWMAFSRVERLDIEEPTQAYQAKIDLTKETELFNMPTTLKFGARWDTRTKKANRQDTFFDADILADNGIDLQLSDIQRRRQWDGNFPTDFAALLYSADTAVALFNDIAFTQDLGVTETADNGFSTNITSYYKVQEDIYAGYGMATFDFDWGNVVAGLRVEASENEGQAYGTIDGGGFELFNEGSDRTDVFPSLHINYDITENQKFRLSFNSGLARPDFDDRAPNFSINDTVGDESVSGGNPFADPERTYGIDAYYEYYLEPVGIFSAGAFYKKIEDPLINVTTTVGTDELNFGGVDRSGYEFNTIGNGQEGFYQGIELAYAQQFDFLSERFGLPEWADGFGFNGNLTLVDSEITLDNGRDVPLEGSSDETYNASVYWENYGFSFRVNYQWRTRWINAYGSSEEFDRYWAALGRLSLGARYQVNDNLEWFFDANNLTDQFGRRINGDRSRVYEIEGFGPRYLTGVRFNF